MDKKIKKFRLKINPSNGSLVDFISLVEKPAIEVDFLKFNKQIFEKLQYDNDRMELLGPVLIPNQDIYRYSEKMGEYYIYFTVDDIKEIQLEFMKNGFQNNVNLDHTKEMANTFVFGFFQSSDLISNPKGFEDLPIGTLYAQMRVTDKQVWEDIKSGKRKGFSIEGIFEYLVEEFESSFTQKSKNSTTNLIEDQDKNYLESMIKDLFRKVFNELSKELEEKEEAKLETNVETEVETEISDWTLVSSNDFKIETREVGAKVEIIDANGTLVAAPDGSYEFEDGFKFVVKDGLIESIDGSVEQPAPVEDTQMAEDWQAKIDALNVEISSLKTEIESIKTMIDGVPTQEDMSKEFEQIKNEFKNVFEKFSKIPAESSKVNKNVVLKEEEERKFQEFLKSLRK